MVMQIGILIVALFLIPAVVGLLFSPLAEGKSRLMFCWVSGQVLLWAGFQLICVPMILVNGKFEPVFQSFCIYMMALLVLSIAVVLQRRSKRAGAIAATSEGKRERDKKGMLLWGLFFLILLIQIVLAVVLSYEEGDDAYYVAISAISIDADNMYVKYPYTGGVIPLDIRHALAPFPVWISVISRLSDMIPVSVCHVVLPISMLLMAYSLYYLLGEKLLISKKQLLPFYMILVQIMIMFGGYSVFTTERFLLVRAAQGKAVLGSIIIPFLLLLLYLLLEHINSGQKVGIGYWILVFCVMVSGCLCSTLGTFLLCLLTGIVGLCILVSYRKWKVLFPLGICMLAPIAYAALYFVKG